MDEVGEIEVSLFAFEAMGRDIIRASRHIGSRVRAKPNARFLAWLPDLGYPFSPTPLPHAVIHETRGVARSWLNNCIVALFRQ